MNGNATAAIAEADLRTFQTVRSRLFGIAYRIAGSPADADDIVQDAWIRWQEADRGAVRDARAFLATMTTRLAINSIQCARARHETHVGESLADRVDPEADPTLPVERREALERGVHLLLAHLSPAERAAYVLREAFDYPYRQVGRALGLSEDNARQLAARARVRISGDRGGRPTDVDAHRRLVDALAAAGRSGDPAELEQMLAIDVRAGSNRRVLTPDTAIAA